MKAALKYCGGCNPCHDRVNVAKRLARAFDGRLEWVSPKDPEVNLVVVIAGCETACVDVAPFKDKYVVLVRREKDVDACVKDIEKLLSPGQS